MKFGKNNDLSLFRVNIHKYQEIELHVKNNLTTIYLNEKQVLEMPFIKNIGDIVGFNLNFSSTGSIDYLKLSNQKDEVVYYSAF